jgi:phosphoglycerate dehydrogenase-like enzyme
MSTTVDRGLVARKVIISVGSEMNLPPGWEVVEELATILITRSDAETAAALAGADALFLWNFDSRVLQQTGIPAKLSWIHTPSLGVDAFMTEAVVRSPVVVSNTRGVFERPMAEYVLGLMLAIAKDFRTTFDSQKRREWNWRQVHAIAGHTVALVGPGAIGAEIHNILTAVGYEVHSFGRRRVEHSEVFGSVLPVSDLADYLPRMDTVVLALPLTNETWGFMNARRLGQMKPGATLINIGRGGLVDEAALLESVTRGTLGMAALDVFAQEPLPAAHPFWSSDRVIVSPHMSGDTVGYRERLFRQFATNLERWCGGLPLQNRIDKSKFEFQSRAARA